MGAIKDVIDLVEKLDNSIKDRKTLDLLLPIKNKIIDIEREQLNLEKAHFQMELKSNEEKLDLISLHEKEVSDLKSKIKELESNSKPFVGSIPIVRG